MKFLLKQFKEIKESFDDSNCIELTEEAYLKYQDILELLEQRGYLYNIKPNNCYMCHKKVSLDCFEDWLKEQFKESKRMKRREYNCINKWFYWDFNRINTYYYKFYY